MMSRARGNRKRAAGCGAGSYQERRLAWNPMNTMCSGRGRWMSEMGPRPRYWARLGAARYSALSSKLRLCSCRTRASSSVSHSSGSWPSAAWGGGAGVGEQTALAGEGSVRSGSGGRRRHPAALLPPAGSPFGTGSLPAAEMRKRAPACVGLGWAGAQI